MNGIEASNDLYSGISQEIRTHLKQYEQTSTVPRGARLVETDVLPDHLTILISGKAETCVYISGKPVSLGIMGPGRVFGLHSVLSGEAPHTTVTCLEECKITRVPREAFNAVLAQHPEMYFSVVKVLSGDLASADHVLCQNARASWIRPGRKARMLV